MSGINLYDSCHAFTSINAELNGGTIDAIMDPNINVPLYSTVHINKNIQAILKGGDMDTPQSLSSSSNSVGYAILGISGLAYGICSDFGDQIDGIVGNLDKAKSMLDSPFDLLGNELSGLGGLASSSVNDIDSGINSLEYGVDDTVPDLPDTSEIERIMEACGLLRANLINGYMSIEELLSKYFDAASKLLDLALSKIMDGLSLIESGAALILSEINKLLKFLGIDVLLEKLDGLINCLEAICGRSFNIPEAELTAKQEAKIEYDKCKTAATNDRNLSDAARLEILVACRDAYEAVPEPTPIPTAKAIYLDYIDEVNDYTNNILNDMNLDDFGKLDTTKIFSSYPNIEQGVLDNITTLADNITNETSIGEEKLTSLVDNMKPMMNSILADLEEAASSYSGTTEELLAELEEKDTEVKELLTELENTVDKTTQQELITQINVTKNSTTDLLTPAVQEIQDMQSFFT